MINTIQPILFIGHGSPMNMIEENSFTKSWKEIAQELAEPKSILMLSAHWYTHGTLIQTAEKPEMIYDMKGFPEEIYAMSYPAHTDKELIMRVQELISPHVNIRSSQHGYDHGAYAPLLNLFPEANIPVTQLSINADLTVEQSIALGKALRVLREEGYLIIASGNIVHNLRAFSEQEHSVYKEALDFDRAMIQAVKDRDTDTLINYHKHPGAGISAPTPDHLLPLFYVYGALKPTDKVQVFNEQYQWGSLSMTSFIAQ